MPTASPGSPSPDTPAASMTDVNQSSNAARNGTVPTLLRKPVGTGVSVRGSSSTATTNSTAGGVAL